MDSIVHLAIEPSPACNIPHAASVHDILHTLRTIKDGTNSFVSHMNSSYELCETQLQVSLFGALDLHSPSCSRVSGVVIFC